MLLELHALFVIFLRNNLFEIILRDKFSGVTSIRGSFKLTKSEKLFNASNEFHISDYFHLVIFCGD